MRPRVRRSSSDSRSRSARPPWKRSRRKVRSSWGRRVRTIVAVAGSARGRRLAYVSSIVGAGLSLQGCMDPGGGLAVVPRMAPVMFTSSLVAIASYFYKLKLIKGIVDSVLELVDTAVKRAEQALDDNAEWLAEIVAMSARGICVVIATVTGITVAWLVAPTSRPRSSLQRGLRPSRNPRGKVKSHRSKMSLMIRSRRLCSGATSRKPGAGDAP